MAHGNSFARKIRSSWCGPECAKMHINERGRTVNEQTTLLAKYIRYPYVCLVGSMCTLNNSFHRHMSFRW
jgi:hypothetical protein